ncbi:hypothetical protein KJ940_03125 [Myxococcota bacterium]|nr:hypothetical protein [Myxococcota bacterium]
MNNASRLCMMGLLLTLHACVLDDGLSNFDAIDEDFNRDNPKIAAQESALTQSCASSFIAVERDEVFQRALCLCGDLDNVGEGVVTSSHSGLVGDDPGLAHVGVNGRVDVVGDFNVDGGMDVAGGLEGVGDLHLNGALISGRGLDVVGDWSVGGDAWIDGDLSVVGDLTIGGDLFLTGDFDAVGDVRYQNGRRGFHYRGAPCGCGAKEIIDVAAEVAQRRNDNDNDLISGLGAREVVFESGEYYFARGGELVGNGAIKIRGRVRLFIEGDLESVGDLNIQIEDGGALELWTSGTIKSVGNLHFGAAGASARALRLYMGGQGGALMSVGNATFIGAIYAPEVDIEFVGDLKIDGALFARRLEGTGRLDLTYDTDVSAPDGCVDEYTQRFID